MSRSYSSNKDEYTLLEVIKRGMELPEVYIYWINGEKVLLSSVTPDMLKETNALYHSYPDYDYLEYRWGGYLFVIDNDAIERFKARSSFGFQDDNNFSGFWDKAEKKYYQFPISAEEADELFGKGKIYGYMPK